MTEIVAAERKTVDPGTDERRLQREGKGRGKKGGRRRGGTGKTGP